jgi:hypothetical protein
VLAPEEKLELEGELRTSAAARREFWAYTRMHAVVHEVEKRNALIVPEESDEYQPERDSTLLDFLRSCWRPKSLPIALSGVAWIILAAFLAQNFLKQKTATPKRQFVGELRHDLEAEWAGDSPTIDVHQPVQAETLHLKSGAVEIALVNGIIIAIQGPAKFEFLSADRLVLKQGRVCANVPREARGFTVETPASTVVDRGTRFGVRVEENGVTEADVFEGKIDVSPDKSAIKKQTSPQRITDNQAVLIDPVKKSMLVLKSDPNRFPQPERLTDNLLADPDFESGIEPAPDGLPTKFGQWGGDFCHLTGMEMGIQPQSGRSMLRFLRGDNTRSNGETHPNSELWQIVDLRPYKKLMASGRVDAELSCYFNRVAGEDGSAQRFGMNMFAFRGALGDPDSLWARRNKAAVGSAHPEMITDDTPATWQRLEAKMPLPADADFLIVQIYAGSVDGLTAEQPVLAGTYADSAVLRLRVAPKLGPVMMAKSH